MVKYFANALRLRCPRCGRAGLRRSWFSFRDACPHCGLDLDRSESGYQVGSYLIAMIAIELIFAAIFIAILVATWPTPPWSLLQWTAPVLMVLGPVLLFPFTKTLFLAVDLTLRRDT